MICSKKSFSAILKDTKHPLHTLQHCATLLEIDTMTNIFLILFLKLQNLCLTGRLWIAVCFLTFCCPKVNYLCKQRLYGNRCSKPPIKKTTIVWKIFEETLKNQAKLDKTQIFWCLPLRNFWALVPKNYFWREDWKLDCAYGKFWDFSSIS